MINTHTFLRISRRVFTLAIVFMLLFTQTAFGLTRDDRERLYTPFTDENYIECASSSITGSGNSMFVIGDSLTVGMRDSGGLQDKLSAQGWAVSDIQATTGETVDSALDRLKDRTEGDDEVEVGFGAGTGVFVVALGTNPEGNFGRKVGQMIDKLRELSPNAKIYWMNAYTPADNNARYADTNATLASQASAKNFRVIDWAAEAAANPGTYPFAGDNIHHNGQGYQTKADFLVRSVGSAGPAVRVGSGTVNLSGGDNEEKTWNFFIAAGLSPVQAAGVMGNLAIESGFNPFIQERSQSWPGGGWGIAQWSFGRRTALADAVIADLGSEFYISDDEAEANGMAGTEAEDRLLAFQLQFLYNESQGRESLTYPDAANEWEGLKRETTIDGATTYWEANFERPLHAGQQVRIDRAQAIYDHYTGTEGGGGDEGGEEEGDGFDPVDNSGGGGCGAVVNGTTDGADAGEDTSGTDCPVGTEDAGVRQDYGPGRVPTIKIRVCNVKGVSEVNASIAQATLSMLNDAEAAGHVMTGSAFRSYDRQVELRQQNGCPADDTAPSSTCTVPTAPPGNSNHEVGLAIDFSNMCFPNSTCPSSPAWQWLMDNAGSYGFQKLSSEAWHWSPDGR